MERMKDGTYEAKPIDYILTETKDGTPQVAVMFKTTEEKPQVITWYGILNGGKAQDFAIKALLTMGLRGNDLAPLANGKDSNLLDLDNVVQIVVESHEYEGKTQQRVSWVNRVPGFRKPVNPQVATKVASLRGAVAALRQETGIKDPGPSFASFNGAGSVGGPPTSGGTLGF